MRKLVKTPGGLGVRLENGTVRAHVEVELWRRRDGRIARLPRGVRRAVRRLRELPAEFWQLEPRWARRAEFGTTGPTASGIRRAAAGLGTARAAALAEYRALVKLRDGLSKGIVELLPHPTAYGAQTAPYSVQTWNKLVSLILDPTADRLEFLEHRHPKIREEYYGVS